MGAQPCIISQQACKDAIALENELHNDSNDYEFAMDLEPLWVPSTPGSLSSTPMGSPVSAAVTPFSNAQRKPTRWRWEVTIPAEDLRTVGPGGLARRLTAVKLLGLKLMAAPAGSLVYVIEPGGYAERFNNARPDDAIREGDCILEVNGAKASPEAVRDELLAGRPLSLKVERVRGGADQEEIEWTVTVDGPFSSPELQVDTPSLRPDSTLRVARVDDEAGLLMSPTAIHALRRGDVILAVNGESSSAAAMAAALTQEEMLTIRVSRKKLNAMVKFEKNLVDRVFSNTIEFEGSEGSTSADSA
jgi:hypothetical protein